MTAKKSYRVTRMIPDANVDAWEWLKRIESAASGCTKSLARLIVDEIPEDKWTSIRYSYHLEQPGGLMFPVDYPHTHLKRSEPVLVVMEVKTMPSMVVDVTSNLAALPIARRTTGQLAMELLRRLFVRPFTARKVNGDINQFCGRHRWDDGSEEDV
jgi:hypothetical protein